LEKSEGGQMVAMGLEMENRFDKAFFLFSELGRENDWIELLLEGYPHPYQA
jgi:hypothetical protein